MKRYAVKVFNGWSEDHDGTWWPMSNEQVVAICDSKEKAKELIFKAIHVVNEKLDNIGEEHKPIEELNDGWRYKLIVKDDDDNFAFTTDEEYITYCEEFEEGILNEIEL